MSAIGRPCNRIAPLALCATLLALCGGLLEACAGPRDHFYALAVIPDIPRPPTAGAVLHVILHVSIPNTVDRPQMVLADKDDRLLVLEHERWPTPLSILLYETLARDLEQRRADVLVADRGFDRPDAQPVRIQVDVVRLSARFGGQAFLEAHWRIVDPAAHSDRIGSESLSAAVPASGQAGDYAPIARALSACIAALADRLTDRLPAR